MRAINKGQEPESLITHRKKPASDYDNYKDKKALREFLISEQRGLCCYCMSRIAAEHNSMKIEHWKSQRKCPDEQLQYRNLLGACMGGEGSPRDHQHCDTYKGDKNLKWNPAEPQRRIEDWLQYRTDGSIRSRDEQFDSELDHVLNLNTPRLRAIRKAKLDGILAAWRQLERGAWRKLEQMRVDLTTGTDLLQPYCLVEFWWLEQRFKNKKNPA